MVPSDTNITAWIGHLWLAAIIIGFMLIVGTAFKNRRENRRKGKEKEDE